MKKLIAILLMVCLLPLCAASEMDADGDVVVTLAGAEFFFTPITGYCITRESSASVFNRVGLSQREIIPFMEEYNLFALLYDEKITMEVQVSAYPTVETDFDEMNSYGEAMMCEDFRYFHMDIGYDVASVEVYLAPEGHRFIRSSLSYVAEDGATEYIIEYLTCQAGYTVTVTLFPEEGEPTGEQIVLTESIVDSLWIRTTE